MPKPGRTSVLGRGRAAWLAAAVLVSIGAAGAMPPPAAGSDLELSAAGHDLRTGLGQADFDRWAAIRATVTNSGDEPRQAVVTVDFPGLREHAQLQAARNVHVPPRSSQRVIVPIRLPQRPPDQQPQWTELLDVQVRLLEVRGGREIGVDRADVLMRIGRRHIEPRWLGEEGPGLDVVEQMLGTQGAAILHDDFEQAFVNRSADALADAVQSVPLLAPTSLPHAPLALDTLGLLVIGTEAVDLDAAQLEALRKWLVRGGRLWIMLDRTDPVFARRVLGEQWTLAPIDRTELTELTLRSDSGAVHYRHDDPVTLMRVLHEGFEVLHEIDGWPASLGRQVGRGRLLVTTLEAELWPRLKAPAQAQGDEGRDDPLAELGQWLLERPQPQALAWPAERAGVIVGRQPQRRAMTDLVDGQIGFEVVSRVTVGWFLAGFCIVLLGCTFLLHRYGRLEYVAVATVLLAVVTAGSLLSISAAARRQAPLTVASGLLVNVTADGAAARIGGLVGYYAPDDVPHRVATGRGAVLWRDDLWATGRTVRHQWTDLDRYHWTRLRLRGGQVHTFEAEQVLSLDRPARATARLDEAGAEVELATGDIGELEDVVLLTADGAVIPSIRDGRFPLAPRVETAVRSQFIAGAQLTASQRRRQAALRQVVAMGGHRHGSGPPMIAGWSRRLAGGFTLSDEAGQVADAARRDEALVLMPLRVAPPAVGAAVQVPWPLIEWEVVPFARLELDPGPARRVADAMAFQQGRWETLRGAGGRVTMVLSPPRELDGLEPTEGRFSMRVDALGRELDLWVERGEALEAVSIERGGGRIAAELDARQLQSLRHDGRLVLVLDVGRAESEHSAWRIEQPRLSIRGVMAARPPATIERIDADE